MNAYIREDKLLSIGIAEVKPKHQHYTPNVVTYTIANNTTFHKNITNNTRRGVLLYVHNSLQADEVGLQSDFEKCVCAEISMIKGDKLLAYVMYRNDSWI